MKRCINKIRVAASRETVRKLREKMKHVKDGQSLIRLGNMVDRHMKIIEKYI